MTPLETLKERLRSPRKIVITTHQKPDADALGSSLALAGYLKKKQHQVQVITPTDYPKFLHWMPGNEHVLVYSEQTKLQTARLLREADIICCLDFPVLARIEEIGEMVRSAGAYKLLIDHHLEPEHFADFEFWDVQAAATAQLVYELIEQLGDQPYIDVPIGECLYAGIMTDTASFRHSNTTKRVHLISADLIGIGVNTNKIQRLIYDTNTEARLRFMGFALYEKLVVLPQYRTAYFAISDGDLQQFNSQTGDTEGLVNYGLSIEGIMFSAVIIERDQTIRMSFRSVDGFSVNDFARKHFEGGGHQNAAGGKSSLSLEATVQKFLDLLPLYQDQLSAIKI